MPRTTERIMGERPGASLRRLGDSARLIFSDHAHEIVLRHLTREIDGARKTFRVGPAVRLDDYAVQPEENAAIHLARIHLFAEQTEGRLREKVSEPRGPCARHG